MEFLTDNIINILGIVGAAIVLLAFLLNQIGRIKHTDLSYDIANFVGSSFLLIYAVVGNSIPFIIINFVWAGFSLKDILKYYFKKKL